jgi:DNA-directed RNA polymerase specialized sigma subunit
MWSAGMNQKDTAARLGISEGRVSEIFHGLRDSAGQWIP